MTIEQKGEDWTLHVYIQPKASRDSVIGRHNGELKLAITAPPVDGKANAHLIKFIAKQFGVSKSRVVLEKGDTSRHKQVRIQSPKKLPEWLHDYLD